MTKNRVLRQSTVFLFGAFVYGSFEILWRGYTHPTMLLLGGACFSMIYFFERDTFLSERRIFKHFMYALIITFAEFVFGLFLNILLGLDIWDYSDLPLNILGQICVPFYFLWVLLSIISSAVCKAMRFVFGE